MRAIPTLFAVAASLGLCPSSPASAVGPSADESGSEPAEAIDDSLLGPRRLSICEASALAADDADVAYRIDREVDCSLTVRVPRAPRDPAWLVWEATELGLMVVEKGDLVEVRALPPPIRSVGATLQKLCEPPASAGGGKHAKPISLPSTAIRIAVDDKGNFAWAEGRFTSTDTTEECWLREAKVRRRAFGDLKGGAHTLRFPLGGGETPTKGAMLGSLKGRAVVEAKPVRIPRRTLEPFVLQELSGVFSCLPHEAETWSRLELSWKVSKSGVPTDIETRSGKAPATTVACLKGALADLRFGAYDADGAIARFIFRPLIAGSVGGPRWRQRRVGFVTLTNCAAAIRASTPERPFLVDEALCDSKNLWRVDEREGWFEQQAAFNGLLVLEQSNATRISAISPPYRRAIEAAVCTCDFGRFTGTTGREWQRSPPLEIQVRFDEKNKVDWVASTWSPLSDDAATCLRSRFTEAGLSSPHGPAVARFALHDGPVHWTSGSYGQEGQDGQDGPSFTLSRDAVRREIKRNQASLERCFDKQTGGLVDNVSFRKVRLRWRVSRSRAIDEIQVLQSKAPPATVACLKERLGGLVFDLPAGHDRAWVDWTFFGVTGFELEGVPDVIDVEIDD